MGWWSTQIGEQSSVKNYIGWFWARRIDDWVVSISKDDLMAINRKGGVRHRCGVLFRTMMWGENAEKRGVVSPRMRMSAADNA
jgi:hypothetical protein